MTDFYYRTEDIKPSDILKYYVPMKLDEEIVEKLESRTPVILEGSRGTGKSFLLEVARAKLENSFLKERIVPVYMTFRRSSLIHTKDRNQFHHWMLSKICSEIIRCLRKLGLIENYSGRYSILGASNPKDAQEVYSKLAAITQAYEESWKNPKVSVEYGDLPDIDSFRGTIEDLCSELELSRFVFLFDEAAHVLRPEQQRQFFTLFRDLRSPYISCKAAVYPGVTAYGDSFQPAHDASWIQIHRDFHSGEYLDYMREIVLKQNDDKKLEKSISENGEYFNVLAYAASGNPRILLKTVAGSSGMKKNQIDLVIREYYRTKIWVEHSNLSDNFPQHEPLTNWGRNFIEKVVLLDLKSRNDQRSDKSRNETTCYFWMHRNAPQVIKESIRLLAYTGIVSKESDGIRTKKASKGGAVGTRYSVNLGCLFALETDAVQTAFDIAIHLTKRRFNEYGADHQEYKTLADRFDNFAELDITIDVLTAQLAHPLEVLDITGWQRQTLTEAGYRTVGDVFDAGETGLQEIRKIGPVRSRWIKNAATASVLEYLSG